jgi:Cof subfamily protein (haloacid dehalogenase superfamily)
MSPTPLRVVVTDLDGTVVQPDGTLSRATVDAASALQARGVPLIVATARTPAGMESIDHLARLTTVAVCCTGALGWSFATADRLWAHFLDAGTVGHIADVVSRFDHVGFASYDGASWRVTPEYVGFRGIRPRGPLEEVSLADIAAARSCGMALCIPDHTSAEMADLLLSAGITDTYATLTWAADHLLDIAPPGIDKASGVTDALARVGRSWPETLVCGDMPNDLPMLRRAGTAVAPTGSPPEVLDAADLVVPDLANGGFADTLRRFGLIGPVR